MDGDYRSTEASKCHKMSPTILIVGVIEITPTIKISLLMKEHKGCEGSIQTAINTLQSYIIRQILNIWKGYILFLNEPRFFFR